MNRHFQVYLFILESKIIRYNQGVLFGDYCVEIEVGTSNLRSIFISINE